MSLSLKNRIVLLREEGKTYDEIVDELGCSKSTVSYHCNNSNIDNNGKKKTVVDDDLIIKINEYYQNHTGDETAKKFGISRSTVIKYCDNKSGEPLTEEEKKRKNVEYVQRRRHKIKEMAIEYKGGCCQCCGYSKSKRALEFHHLDPTEKDFNISHKGHSRSWERVKKELDKCILLCSNCHAEIHDGLIRFDLTGVDKEEILNTYKWIKVTSFRETDYETLEEKYEALKQHHVEETTFLIDKIRNIIKVL